MQPTDLTAFGSGFSSPLVGRDEEAAALRSAADAVCRERRTRIATLVGPNGVGKSRLIDHFLTGMRSGEERPLRVYRSSAKESPMSYGAFVSLLRARFGLVEGTPPETACAQIRSQVSKVLEDQKVSDVCFFMGQLLDLPFPDSPLTRAVAGDPLQGRLLRRAIIKKFFENDAARSPLCLVFDDLDLAGDDSIALFSYLVEHLSGPILLLCTTRPEMLTRHPGWFDLGGERHQRLEVRPLTKELSAKVMRSLLMPCEGGPPEDLVQAGVKLAGGSPGLLEAMVRIFHDCGVLDEDDALAKDPVWRVNLDKLASVRIPMTVDDAVAMRVASLSTAERRLLEHAAIMGQVFWLGALVVLHRSERVPPELWSGEDETERADIEIMLENLAQRDYVVRLSGSSFVGEAEYAFKHKLEREKLDELTAEEDKRRYHQMIADWFEHVDAVGARESYLALLAHHLERAGDRLQAGLTHLEAGDAAREAYAARNAHQHYEQGLALLGEHRASRRIEALHNHGDVLLLLGKTDAALIAFREMLGLAFRLGLRAKGGAAHNRIGRLYRTTGALDLSLSHLETALALFTAVGDERGVAACHDDVGKVHWAKGEYEQALERMRTALEMRKSIGDRRSIALSLHNIGVVWRDHGRPVQAREALEAALQIRRDIGDLLGVAQTLNGLGRLAQDQRDLEEAKSLYTQAYQVAKEIGEQNRIAVVLTNLGEVHYRLGNAGDAIRILKEAEELCDELGDRLHYAEAKRGLAKAYLMQGELRKARSIIKEAVELFGEVRSKSHLATALRTLGEITAAGAWGAAHEGKAVDYFMRSIALCKEIGNEIEVAKSYHVFSEYVARSQHYRNNEEIQREARKLRAMADEIFARQKLATDRVET